MIPNFLSLFPLVFVRFNRKKGVHQNKKYNNTLACLTLLILYVELPRFVCSDHFQLKKGFTISSHEKSQTKRCPNSCFEFGASSVKGLELSCIFFIFLLHHLVHGTSYCNVPHPPDCHEWLLIATKKGITLIITC